jgi:hypothetical protein
MIMQIASISSALSTNSYNSQPEAQIQVPQSAGQNLPDPAEAAQQYDGVTSSPRAALTASATAVASQAVESGSILDTVQLTAAYQSYMNTQGVYGYQATLGAPLMG